MQRRDFIQKIAASFLVVQGVYLLKGCTSANDDPQAALQDVIDTGRLAEISKPLRERFDTLLAWLNRNGWSDYLERTAGLDLAKKGDDLLKELVRKLNPPLTEKGFDDFAGMRAIEPGYPAMSLLYHALASPRVRPTTKDKTPFAVPAYPSIDQLDILEDYIYALQPFTISREELLNNYVLAVFAYEYRPAFKTPHHAHADLVFSRTGVARIGEHPMNYDRLNRNFTNAPADESRASQIAVMPARYGVFLAKVISGKEATNTAGDQCHCKGQFTLLGTDDCNSDGDPGDDTRYFLQPVRKITHYDPLAGGQPMRFSEYHKTEKLNRIVTDPVYKLQYYPPDADITKPPFLVESKTSTAFAASSDLVSLTAKGSSVLLCPKEASLIRAAEQNGKRIHFLVPEKTSDPSDVDKSNRYFTTFNSQLLVEDIEILNGDSAMRYRSQNEYKHPRNTPLYLNIRYQDDKFDEKFSHLMDEQHIDSRHWTAAFMDNICDGQVKADLVGVASDKADRLPAELFSTCIPAFSIVTAPDFFPQVDSFDLLKYDVNVQLHRGTESNFYEGGLPSMSAGRIRPNPHTVNFPDFKSEEKQALDFTYTAVLSNPAVKPSDAQGKFDQPFLRDYQSSSYLPDVCSFVFAPGWDVTYCSDEEVLPDDIGTNKKKSYLSTRGLGSPFPEDMKLCAAVNGMWPAASPDTARTYQGSLNDGDLNPTAIPLMDDEIGFHANSPAVRGSSPLLKQETFGWDGEQGPFLEMRADAPRRFVVNFTDLRKADYIENLTNSTHGFDMSKLRMLSSYELVMRMEALRQCIKALPGIPFDERFHDNHVVAFTRLWLVSAEKVESWGNRYEGAKGYGIPDHLFVKGRNVATTPQPGILGPGYLYVFVNRIREEPPVIHWDKPGDLNCKRRWQVCETIFVCQVSEKAIAYCILNGNAPYDGDNWVYNKLPLE